MNEALQSSLIETLLLLTKTTSDASGVIIGHNCKFIKPSEGMFCVLSALKETKKGMMTSQAVKDRRDKEAAFILKHYTVLELRDTMRVEKILPLNDIKYSGIKQLSKLQHNLVLNRKLL